MSAGLHPTLGLWAEAADAIIGDTGSYVWPKFTREVRVIEADYRDGHHTEAGTAAALLGAVAEARGQLSNEADDLRAESRDPADHQHADECDAACVKLRAVEAQVQAFRAAAAVPMARAA